MAVKTGKASVAAYYISCPLCEEPIEGRERNGSQLIVAGSGYRPGEVVTCRSCGERFRIPAALRNVCA